ncbi:OmpA family protein [Rhabdochlamydiaceae symbiont of Dictyostelium giganteum]|uniref:OmpA family protein n=1 Tax=Rhabdochlamydiaceae symbiont of Dictyostelium giganteum TaxID=3342349 RepID=UPI00384B8F46
MKTIMQISSSILCLLLFTSCQSKSGNIWDDNQTGAHYKQHMTAANPWDRSHQASFSSNEFLPLNDDDLKNQFTDISIPQPKKELGSKGMPTVEQFNQPQGALSSLFSPIFFDTDQHSVRKKVYIEQVQKAASYLKSHPSTYVIIEGYCDERGPEAYNLALGTRRANFVRGLLIQHGAKPDQIHTISFGKERPFALGHNPDAWTQNRRAHFRIHHEGK